MKREASLMAQTVKNLPAMQETQILSLGLEDPLEKDMATHSTLAWRIPWRLVGYSPWGCRELDMIEWPILSVYDNIQLHQDTGLIVGSTSISLDSKKKLCALYGKWTECLYSVDPATFDAYKKNDKKNTEEKKNSKQVNNPRRWNRGDPWMVAC